MKPALTAEECAWVRQMDAEGSNAGIHLPRHAQAAYNLFGQPFGFTREDVEMVRNEAGNNSTGSADGAAWNSLADRIEALLPPEG